MQKGIIDRFRSLPMSRSAVLVGRTTSDLLNNVIVAGDHVAAGLLVGWRIHTSPSSRRLAGFLLLLLFAYAISWIMAFIGLSVPSVDRLMLLRSIRRRRPIPGSSFSTRRTACQSVRATTGFMR